MAKWEDFIDDARGTPQPPPPQARTAATAGDPADAYVAAMRTPEPTKPSYAERVLKELGEAMTPALDTRAQNAMQAKKPRKAKSGLKKKASFKRSVQAKLARKAARKPEVEPQKQPAAEPSAVARRPGRDARRARPSQP